MAPFFSIGIPTFNRADLLRGCIEQLLGQSFTDFELIISDNHSTDDTPAVVESFSDSRLTYHRHDEPIDPELNWLFVAERARGTFFVINQDDDLLHRDFLERCHECVAGDDRIVMYACSWWHGDPDEGLQAQLMGDPDRRDFDYAINDQPLLLDGRRMAVSLLYSFYFAHPAVAFRRSAFEAIGRFYREPDTVFDIITEARLLCRGMLAYDPRIGAAFRVHGGNVSRSLDPDRKRRLRSNRFKHVLLNLQEQEVDWERYLDEALDAMPLSQLMKVFQMWVRAPAPLVLQEIGWQKLWQKNPHSRRWLWRRLAARGGAKKLARFQWRRLRHRPRSGDQVRRSAE